MGLFSTYTMRGMFRALRCFLLKREPVTRGVCLQCGACCRNLLLHVDGHWIRDKSDLHKLHEAYPEFRKFRDTGKRASGVILLSCDWLTEDNTCAHYEDRPAICKAHPTPTIWFAGAEFPASCGFHIEEAPSFKRVLARARRSRKRDQ